MIALYHGGPYGHSASVLILLAEKGQDFVDHPVDLARFGEHDPAFLAINPEGMVPVLVADGKPLTETAFILHYIEERFPEPRFDGATGKERYLTHNWDKYVEGYLAPALAIVSAAKGAPAAARDGLDRLSPERRRLWLKALEGGFSEVEATGAHEALRLAAERIERALGETPWLGGAHYGLADMLVFPQAEQLVAHDAGAPGARTIDWMARIRARPAVAALIARRDTVPPAFALGPEAPRWG